MYFCCGGCDHSGCAVRNPPCPARAAVAEFLTEIYHELAEPLPEMTGNNSALTLGKNEEDPASKRQKKRGRRPRARIKQDDFSDLSQMRVLPPGTIHEYHEMCQMQNPGLTISRKVFDRVPLAQ